MQIPKQQVDDFSLRISALVDDTSLLLCAGAPLRQGIVAKGSMVMTSEREIAQAYGDYERGKFGTPWEHTLSDVEWKEHVERDIMMRK